MSTRASRIARTPRYARGPSCARCRYAALPSTGPPSRPNERFLQPQNTSPPGGTGSAYPQQGRRPRGHERRRGARGAGEMIAGVGHRPGHGRDGLRIVAVLALSGETAICGGSSSCTARSYPRRAPSLVGHARLPSAMAALPRRGAGDGHARSAAVVAPLLSAVGDAPSPGESSSRDTSPRRSRAPRWRRRCSPTPGRPSSTCSSSAPWRRRGLSCPLKLGG